MMILALAATATAQTSASGQDSSNTSGAVSANSQAASAQAQSQQSVQAVLTKSIDAKKAKPGDKVEAKTTSAAKGGGNVDLPKGTKLIGHVTEAKTRAKGTEDSSLGIAFDNAVLKNGQQVPFHALIRGVTAPQTTPPSSDMGIDSSTSAGISPNRSGGPMSGNPGPLSGVGSTVGGVTNTAGSAVGGVSSSVGTTAGNVGSTVGNTTNASLGANSGGVVGLPGVSLNAQGSNQANGSVLISNSQNVKLDSGTTMLLQITSE